MMFISSLFEDFSSANHFFSKEAIYRRSSISHLTFPATDMNSIGFSRSQHMKCKHVSLHLAVMLGDTAGTSLSLSRHCDGC